MRALRVLAHRAGFRAGSPEAVGPAGRARFYGGAGCILLAVALTAGAPTPLTAQVPDSSEVRPDSARARILDAVRRLSRGPVPDTAVRRMADSARAAADSARGGRSRGRRGGAGQARGSQAADSVTDALLGLEGYSVTAYEGQSATFNAQNRRLLLRSAEGNRATVRREGIELAADSAVEYDEASGRVRSIGRGTYTPEEGDPVDSRVMVYDLNQRRGSALGAETTFTQGANWIMRGDLPSVTNEASYGHDTRFTSCELDEPHYHFETDEIKIVAGKVMVARPVRLYFADVPVAWLPFIAQGLGSGRTSGLLTPRFSVNDIVRTSSGSSRRISNVGFYWAMSDYSDALVSMDWFSGEFFALTSSIRYHWLRQFLRGDLNIRRFWRNEGGTELALDTRNTWQISERTSFRSSARFASSTDFVRRNSFDPRELTQTIDSDAGLSRRFDWGNLSLSWNRRQSLTDDRVDATLPSANLSLSTVTLFGAPPSRASWYNNLTWSGGVSFSRRTRDFSPPDTATFSRSTADQLTNALSANSTLTLGNFNLSQRVSLDESIIRDVPADTVFSGGDLSEAELDWSTSLDYQQRLVGSTTITPSLSINGRAKRSDEIEEAASLVSAPTRVSFGARLKTDMYRFYPGFGSYEAVRHKVSPSFDYQYAPSVDPSDLQSTVFGSRETQRRNQITIGLNQTFEAKVAQDEEADSTPAAETPDTATGPRRQERAEIVTLLSIQTSAINYDFVQADSLGDFQAGFTSTRLRNQIGSDFLRGTNVSMEHDLFAPGEDGSVENRTFDPHLSSLNLGFSFGSSSALFRWLRSLTGQDVDAEAVPEDDEALEEDDFAPATGRDESQVIPGLGREGFGQVGRGGGFGRGGRSGGAPGSWNANVTYSMNRPRDGGDSRQMLQSTLRFQPTEQWSVNWRTSYDVEAGAFNDHIVSLIRDLHRWEATFDFRQTAAGNWTFRFEVSLTDNRDLKFDYEQRNLDAPGGTGARRF